MPSWNFVLTDSTYRPVGEILNASDRNVAIPLSKLATCSFAVRLDNPLADLLLAADGYVKAYRDGVLRFFGPVVSADETGAAEGTSVAVNASDPGWLLQKRLVGKSATGTRFITPIDRAAAVGSLLTTVNTEDSTGIVADASNASASSIIYQAGPYKFYYDVLTELAAGTAGFDWQILPQENFANGVVLSQTIATLYIRPVLGINRDEAIYEFGTGRHNVASYRRAVTRDTQADKVYHIASPGPDVPGYPVVFQDNAEAIGRYHLMEDIAQADLLDLSMRQALVDSHVEVRAFPRQTIEFTPHIDPIGTGRLPEYGVDFEVGDGVRLRIANDRQIRVDALCRVWGVTFSIDPNGIEHQATVLAEA